jgi:hypothetical protein
MKNPKQITSINNSTSYQIPTYVVTNEGIADGNGLTLNFCKGSTNDESIYRQEGVFTETILQVALENLVTVNVGDLASRDTSIAITKIEEALMLLNKRKADRELRNVLGTYNK